MPASVAMPAVRQNRSKLAPTCCQASSTIAAGKTPAGVVDLFMALLSFEDSAPRAYRLQVGNAYLTFSTSVGTSPGNPSDIVSTLGPTGRFRYRAGSLDRSVEQTPWLGIVRRRTVFAPDGRRCTAPQSSRTS